MILKVSLQVLGVLCSAATPLVFAAPQLPYLKQRVRPTSFENGWRQLNIQRNLNHQDEGFEEVLDLLLPIRIGSEPFAEVIADDLREGTEEVNVSEAVEELRLLTEPKNFVDYILVCYDEDSGGPQAEPKETGNHGFKLNNTDPAGDDWRWFGPHSAVEHIALEHAQEQINRWKILGAVTLSLSVIFQLTAMAL